MTRRVFLVAALFVFSSPLAWAQNYGPQPGVGAPRVAQQAQPQPAQQRPPVGGQFGGPPAGGLVPQIPPSPQPPAWAINMSPEEQKWLDEVIGYWEARSNKIKTF